MTARHAEAMAAAVDTVVKRRSYSLDRPGTDAYFTAWTSLYTQVAEADTPEQVAALIAGA